MTGIPTDPPGFNRRMTKDEINGCSVAGSAGKFIFVCRK